MAAVTKPAVKFEVWLPLADWNGKFQGVGNGANAGSIGYGAMATALRRGYATASTDTGHATTNARDGSWAVGHPELLVDFGYRAIHVTADNGKKIVQAFYRQPPRQSYFVGCSTGGRQALMEAQRFPDDYDGIVAGAPAANWTRFQTGGHLWVALALNKDPESYIPSSKLRVLDDAVLAACDAIDGIADGVLDDPRQCKFDPQALALRAGKDAASCLTPKQVKAVKDIWSGARDSSGKEIYPGYMPGAEAAGGWASYMSGTGPLTGNHWEQAENVLKYMVFENPKWDFRTFDYDRDVPLAEAKLGKNFDAFDPDLTRFRAARRQAHSVSRLERPVDFSAEHRQLLRAASCRTCRRAGAVSRPRRRRRNSLRLFMAPGHAALRRRARPQHVRHAGRARELGGKGSSAPERVIAQPLDRPVRRTAPGRSASTRRSRYTPGAAAPTMPRTSSVVEPGLRR